jgi:uncharacterized protein (TIGR03435 family)
MLRIPVWAGALLIGCTALSQETPPARFDAVSIRVTDPNVHEAQLRLQPGGRLTATNVTLRDCLRRGFAVENDQISGGPEWMNEIRWSIFAESDSNPDQARMLAMFQQLLVDRFQLKVHMESRQVDMYALVVGKKGAKLAASEGDPEHYLRIYPKPPLTLLDGHRAPMAYLVDRLRTMLHTPVVDQTGLTGEYDFKLEFAKDDDPDSGPSMLSALQEQLGLKLERTRGPIQFLIVDRVEKPSAN